MTTRRTSDDNNNNINKTTSNAAKSLEGILRGASIFLQVIFI